MGGASDDEAAGEALGDEEARKVQPLTRFTPEDVEAFERSSEGRRLEYGFFMLALLYMWPYQTLVQTQNFLVAKFPDQKNTIGNTMLMATTWPFLLTHLALTFTGLSRRLSYKCKLVVPGCIVACVAVYLIAVFLLCSDASVLLSSLYGAALIVSVAEGTTEPAVYDMAGLYPSALTSEMVQSGNGACGLVVSVVSILTRLLTSGVQPLGEEHLQRLVYFYFFLMSLAGLGVPLIYICLMRRTAMYRRFVLDERAVPSADDGRTEDTANTSSAASLEDSPSASSEDAAAQGGAAPEKPLAAAGEALRHLWPSVLAVVLTFGTTLTLWPVIPGLMCLNADREADTALRSWWFDVVIFTFNLCDFLGKSESRSLSWGAKVLAPRAQLACAVLRACLFLPLQLTSSAPQSYEPTVAKWVSLGSVALLGLTNGWLSTVCFMRGPKALPAGTSNVVAEQASTVLVIGLFAGISLGCLLAFELSEGPLSQQLGACYGAK